MSKLLEEALPLTANDIQHTIEWVLYNTRRERIATAALAGLLARTWKQAIGRHDTAEASALAVKHADALIAELDKVKP